jgi:hypothetical protein
MILKLASILAACCMYGIPLIPLRAKLGILHSRLPCLLQKVLIHQKGRFLSEQVSKKCSELLHKLQKEKSGCQNLFYAKRRTIFTCLLVSDCKSD